MNKTLKIEYEIFEEDDMTVLSVIDKKTALNIFRDKEADEIYRLLTEDGMSLEHYLKEVRAKVINEFAERLRPVLNTYHDRVMLDEIVGKLKEEVRHD